VLAEFDDPPQASLRQIHSNIVHWVNDPGEWEGDGLLSQTPGLLLRVSAADCYPVLLEDPLTGTVGALHSGWRGTLQGILPVALAQLQAAGSDLSQVRVGLGAGIAGNCYLVGEEVAQQFRDAGYEFGLEAEEEKYRLDLAAILEFQARQAGIQSQNWAALGSCTHCEAQWFSYRRDGPQSGRMWGLIQVAPR
jgi:YfiH family protein